MKLSEYLEIGKKMKAARTEAGISQREMAKKLDLGASSYSNYENGYSEPPVEIVLKFCDLINISFEDLLGQKVPVRKSFEIETFSDLLSVLIDLDRQGIPVKLKTSYIQEENQLVAHLEFDISSPQLASVIPDWNKKHDQLENGIIDADEYQKWLDEELRIFNVPIDEYVYHKK